MQDALFHIQLVVHVRHCHVVTGGFATSVCRAKHSWRFSSNCSARAFATRAMLGLEPPARALVRATFAHRLEAALGPSASASFFTVSISSCSSTIVGARTESAV